MWYRRICGLIAAMHWCVKSRQSQVAFAHGSAAESSAVIPRYQRILILFNSSMVLFFFVQGSIKAFSSPSHAVWSAYDVSMVNPLPCFCWLCHSTRRKRSTSHTSSLRTTPCVWSWLKRYGEMHRWYVTGVANTCTAWCSEIGSLWSLDAPDLHAPSDVREPISLHQTVSHVLFEVREIVSTTDPCWTYTSISWSVFVFFLPSS